MVRRVPGDDRRRPPERDCPALAGGYWNHAGAAADGSTELRGRLAKTLLRAADAHEVAAAALGRYGDTLAELQFRRNMLSLDVAANLVSITTANGDIARWRDQALSEALEAARPIGIARAELDAVAPVFRELSRTPTERPPPGVPHHPPWPWSAAIPGRPVDGPRPRTNHNDGDDSSPYAATENLAMYQQRLAELKSAIADGHDVFFPIRGTSTWTEWRAVTGRDLGRIER